MSARSSALDAFAARSQTGPNAPSTDEQRCADAAAVDLLVRRPDLATIDLGGLDALASLQTRVDRKYIFDLADLRSLLDVMAGELVVLDVAGRRSFGYESVYFDTPDLEAYLSSATGRRRRFKVRTRAYLDSEVAMLEVKTRGSRDVTVKQRIDYDFADRGILTETARQFIDETVGRPGLAEQLQPTLVTNYARTTMATHDGSVRVTVDAGLRCLDPNSGESVTAGRLFIEAKAPGGPSAIDRWLWRHGNRPSRISKYGTGLAALRPDLPANKWHRTLHRHFEGSR